MKAFLEKEELFLWMEEDKILGSMAVNHEVSEGYNQVKWKVAALPTEVSVLHILGVNPNCQGKGVAKQMVADVIGMARENHQKAIRLDAVSDNIPAQHLYLESGFEYRGAVKLYYENTGLAEFLLYEYEL